jgi:hypothetical protein
LKKPKAHARFRFFHIQTANADRLCFLDRLRKEQAWRLKRFGETLNRGLPKSAAM